MSELNLLSLKGKKREASIPNDWGGYMKAKIRKLDEQFDGLENNIKQSTVSSNLFKNVVIFVNGYTVPSSDELKRLMKQHGGGFQHYYSRARCTHIVATNLPDSKIRELRDEKVVHPDWILHSIKAEKLLPYREYLLYGSGKKYGNNKDGTLRHFVKQTSVVSDVSCGESTCNCEPDGNSRVAVSKSGLEGISVAEYSEGVVDHLDSATSAQNEFDTKTSSCDTIDSEYLENRSEFVDNNNSDSNSICGMSEAMNTGAPGSGELIESSEEGEVKCERKIGEHEMELSDDNASSNELFGMEAILTNSDEDCEKILAEYGKANGGFVASRTVKERESKDTGNVTTPEGHPVSEKDDILLTGDEPLAQNNTTVKHKSLLEYQNEGTTNITAPKCPPTSDKQSIQQAAHQTLAQPRMRGKHRSVPKAGDKNFVNDYYTHSRLHYLSTWGAEFREFINSLIQTTKLKIGGKPSKKRSSKRRVVMHIDMDSFFVSVALRSRPELRGKPVAVCHAGSGNDIPAATGSSNSSTSFGSTSEIASCSYEARCFGVKNGMWLGHARQLCPDIVCVPYQFTEYRQVSQQLYEILASYTHDIQAVSCDEAFVDLTDYIESECLGALEVAKMIRDEIREKTSCPASAGIASNILLARMCTNVAKPNGQFHLQNEEIPEFIGKQKVSDLPGVGYALNEKLRSLNVITCMDLQRLSLTILRREFGQKTGEMLHNFCRGKDERPLKIERERKSVSAEINYAMRFEQESEPERFIHDLSNEVQKRLKSVGMKGKQVTFKLRVRQKDAPINPVKFMGCGRCDNMSRSTTISSFTDDPSLIAKHCIVMLKQLGVPVSDIRGMGIQISKLSEDNRKSSSMSKTLHNFVKPLQVSSNETTGKTSEISDTGYEGVNRDKNVEGGSGSVTQVEACDVVENDEEFKLVLSDDEKDEVALAPEVQDRKNSTNITSTPSNCGKKNEQDAVCDEKKSSSSQEDFPPLPVFPIFSPKRRSPSAGKSSPSRGKYGTRSKRTPSKSPRKSPKKSPAKMSSQRNLYSSFQSLKEGDPLPLPSPSQIDPEVFAALPPEIKKDIEISYQQQNLRLGLKPAEKPVLGATKSNLNTLCPAVLKCVPPGLPVVEQLAQKEKQDITERRKKKQSKKSKGKNMSVKHFATKKPEEDVVMSQLDASVLGALPESMRHEVQLAYEQQKRHDEKERKKNETVDGNKNGFMSGKNDAKNRNGTDAPSFSTSKVCLAGAESMPEIREMLRLWIEDASDPLDTDVRVFVEYLSSLIDHKDLEKLWLVLKFYHRLIRDKKSWHLVFNTVLDSVQSILKNDYDGRLPIEHFVIN